MRVIISTKAEHDLITIGEGYKAEELALKTWGTRQ